MARTTKPKASTTTTVTHKLPKGAVRPTTCGKLFELFADKAISEAGCKRLPRHHGEHSSAKPRGLMTAAQRAARVTKPKASKLPTKVVTIGGTKFLVTLKANGEAVLTKVTVAETAEPAVEPAKPATRVRTRRPVGPKGRDVQTVGRARRQPAAPRTSNPESKTPNRSVRAKLAAK